KAEDFSGLRNGGGKAVRALVKLAGRVAPRKFQKVRTRIPGRFLGLAGNVDLERRRHAVCQLGCDFVFADNLDRLGKLDAPLIDFKTLSGERLSDIAGGNGTEELIVLPSFAREA